MSAAETHEPTHEPFPAPEPRDGGPASTGQGPRRRWGRWTAAAAGGLLLLALLLGVSARLFVNTDPGRATVLGLVNGIEVGPAGRLRLEGLAGDPLTTFRLRRLTIDDGHGAWLEARDIAVRWSPGALLRRRVHVLSLEVGDLVVARRPVLKPRPPRPPSRPPVAVALDALRGRVETRADFSVRPGDWDVTGRLTYDRSGAAATVFKAASRLHGGDGLDVDAAFGAEGRLRLRAKAFEAAGGALAGSLGLAAQAPFVLTATADGDARTGRFDLHSRSGEARPADVTGAWGPAGAHAEGRLALASSRVLAPFVPRIGPEARFVLDGRPRADGLQDVQLRIDGAFAHARASGPVSLADRRTPGLKVELQAADLSKWLHLATVGPVRAVGTVKGVPERFAYEGRVAADSLKLGSAYVLAHAEGPGAMTLDGKTIRLQGDLQGSGGAGSGLAATLLGPRPRVQADVSLVEHGRLGLKALHLSGANLKVDATGGQAIFGGAFTFQGAAQVASLAGARPGAAGGLDAAWTAQEAKGHGWSFSVDAKGRGPKTGLTEADRLLGPQPRLTAKGTYVDGALQLAQVELTGAASHVTGHGGVGGKGELAADFDWQAKGPFAAGPVEVTGEARGRGKVTGSLSKPEADLSADLASLDLGRLVIKPAHLALAFVGGAQGVEGRASLDGPTEWGAAKAKTAFRFADGGLALTDLSADAGGVALSGAVALRDGAPSTADLTLKAGKGAFLGCGVLQGAFKLTARPGEAAVVAAAFDGRDLSLPDSTVTLRSVSLKADGPLAALPLKLSVEGDIPTPYRFAGTGVFAGDKPVKTISLSGAGRIRKSELKTLEPVVLRFGPDARSLHLKVAAAGGRIEADAEDRGGAVSAKATLAKVALGELNPDYEGDVDATLALQGQGARLGGRLDVQLTGARAQDAPETLGLNGKVAAVLAGDRIRLDASASNAQGLKSRAALDLPAEAAAEPFRIAVDRTKAVRGDFSAEGELRPLWDLLIGGDRTLAGRVSTRGTMGGTLNDLQIAGDAQVSKGRFQDAPTGLVLQDLEVQARFAKSVIDVDRFAGADGRGGAVTGEGQISLQRDGGSSFALNLKRFQLVDNALAKATASGAVKVVRDAEGHAKLSGALTVDRADITAKPPVPSGVVPLDVTEINLPVKPGEDAAPVKRAGPLSVALDVTLKAARGVFVRGSGLDAELSLDAHVGGSTARTELTGTARVVRGSYDFSGKRFDFDESGAVRLASTADTIRLDLTARREDPALTATVRITGTAAKPQVTLSSVPVLPQDEVLSRVLFGVSASQLSAFQAAQLASAVAGLASGGGFDIMANLRQFARLDRLAIGGDASGATVIGGKYVTDNIYLELTGAGNTRTTTTTDPGRTGSSASVEWRVRKNLSLVSQVWTGGDTRLSVRFRKDY